VIHNTTKRLCQSIALLACLLLASCAPTATFDGQKAYGHIEALCGFGPRDVGSEASQRAADYIAETVERFGWTSVRQPFVHRGVAGQNVIAKRGQGPLIILGTHYDTRPVADRDPQDRSQPVMGANDGGSGAGVLLELARVLDRDVFDQAEVWLVFFDAEDRGDLDGWEWCVGSEQLAARLDELTVKRPAYVLVIDMVGDDDQQIYYEWSSTLWLKEKVWRIADDLGYSAYFVADHRHTILDDHTPFLDRGIPAAVVIDFDYPYWHTGHDTIDKISVESLQRVGNVAETLLEGEPLVTVVEERNRATE